MKRSITLKLYFTYIFLVGGICIRTVKVLENLNYKY